MGSTINTSGNPKKHFGVVWQLIHRCIEMGYGVGVTDAMKLWSTGPSIDNDLRGLCASVLRKEVNLVQPAKIVAFGQKP